MGDSAAESQARPNDFSSLKIDLRLLKAIRKLGLERPTSVQSRCIPLALEGKDVLARAPTGSGKTYAYVIPLLQKIIAQQDSATGPPEGTSAVVLVPTRELCQQVLAVMRGLLGHAGTGNVRVLQLASAADAAVLRTGRAPDVVVATPSQLKAQLESAASTLVLRDSLRTLVLDEADLLLSYGYGEDIAAIGQALPSSVHTLLLSATITPDLDSITSLFLHNPVTLDVEEDGAKGSLKQFWLRCTHADKFLVMYALFKLNRIPGRSLIFVNSVDRGFRLKLFLEQFGVSSGVLNCELPLDSRWHAIQAFNRGLFDILIATDDPRLMLGHAAEAGASTTADAAASTSEAPRASGKRKARPVAPERLASSADAEFGVSRGVDFCDVTAVINMDLPSALPIYRHRVGRTARGGQGGSAISMVDEGDGNDGKLLDELIAAFPDELHQFHVDMSKLAAFRYRVEDAMRAVTRHAIKEARLREIKQELLHSKKLAEHFDSNPDDLKALRHDKPLAVTRKQPQLANVPAYLKPDTENATASVASVRAAQRRKSGGKKRAIIGNNGKRKQDPLHTFKGGKRGKGGGRGGGGKGGRGRN